MKTTKNISYDFMLPFFCADDALRPAMCMISLMDNNTVCASNGHILVSIPAKVLIKEYDKVEGYPKAEVELERHISKVMKSFIFKTDDLLHVLSHAKWIKRTPGISNCPECNGKGKDTCYACGHIHKCEECEGTGKYQKDAVEFELLRTEEFTTVTISGINFNAEHLHTISVCAKMLGAEQIKMQITDILSGIFYVGEATILSMGKSGPDLNDIKFSQKLLVKVEES